MVLSGGLLGNFGDGNVAAVVKSLGRGFVNLVDSGSVKVFGRVLKEGMEFEMESWLKEA